MKYELDTKGLEQAIARNPAKIKQEVGVFLVRARAMYMGTILQSPWRVGGRGGGAPVDTGDLKSAHRDQISPWQWKVEVKDQNVPYAPFVHDGTRNMSARPWLDYAIDTNSSKLEQMQVQLLDTITDDLAK